MSKQKLVHALKYWGREPPSKKILLQANRTFIEVNPRFIRSISRVITAKALVGEPLNPLETLGLWYLEGAAQVEDFGDGQSS